MTRRDLQRLARQRLRESHALLSRGFSSGAYYLAGYAVECGLKACIAKKVARHEFPDKRLANDAWSHHLGTLVRVAGLEQDRVVRIDASKAFEANWLTVAGWSEGSRYELASEADASALYRAITSRREGVLRWLREHW